MRGISVLAASGDRGIQGRYGCLGPRENIFSPSWPSNCPFVTSVGGTGLLPGETVLQPESAALVNEIGYSSGGGFSNVYLTPQYQKTAVARFFAEHDPEYPYYSSEVEPAEESDGVYNRSGRGYPDVSANTDH